ncbi:RNA-binding (RRM/RBD/RNP motifs) family protein [Striga hermonthica]|uniref:RNA-binding (RRM/RBD/RNP motifs) family protein n=1 Tax=Striga hermonthica TaxID=68872 RepID=A0A9N7NDN9_STRHE|nr:RNA-binding (RRM/RBD/RNP motifs) family protein [Striga hermonthica]
MATTAPNHGILTQRFLTGRHLPSPAPPLVNFALLQFRPSTSPLIYTHKNYTPLRRRFNSRNDVSSSLSSSSSPRKTRFTPTTRLFVSGLSFRTTEESLRNAFKNFGEPVEVNLVMDKTANRPRGFAFLSYATEEESKKAIEGMHGKFLDGRVIFVEIAKSRAELRQEFEQKL